MTTERETAREMQPSRFHARADTRIRVALRLAAKALDARGARGEEQV